MTEEEVSEQLFLAAERDPAAKVLTWQGVDGKGYFAADIRLRLPSGTRVEPDLILMTSGSMWLIEVKSRHSEAQADEGKLAALLEQLPASEIRRQIKRRSGQELARRAPRVAVVFFYDDVEGEGVEPNCRQHVAHVDWSVEASAVEGAGLAALLDGPAT